ncbi:ABC transporter ATPase [Mesomycoplasma conjunctivae]|uniref:ABC transporter ATP binding protein n=1 Tax=Mesomycoplasma conjunctivae (strain ATCC 25834 / NCTC 10147 / HRC/581) TaxID=572263 RepID=C5J5M6_MESCH|nr:ABC transporter ATP-binding protein [Mesomycoplasma conjunctivae]CAT04749.1 ABC transporter ATP binding protein [Mesomycoplasma conjunctivae]VEU65767.1 ABC transporter ATPase [Mesomycoplasma conjunctivae]
MIKITNLNKSFKNKRSKRILFKDFNLEIPSNKLTSIIGESGLGKTTLLHMIANFSKFDSGKIEFFDNKKQLIAKPKLDVVFQNFNLFENLSVLENIKVANGIIGKQFDGELLEKQANFLNIENSVIQSKANVISGGEKQRVSILRAINRDADFILLDEPTGNLDEENSELVFEELKKLSQFKTIVVVTHSKQLAQKFSDKIVNIENNQNITIEDFVSNRTLNKGSGLENLPLEQSPQYNFVNKLKIASQVLKSDFTKKIVQLIMVIFSFIITLFATSLVLTFNTYTYNKAQQTILQQNKDTLIVQKENQENFSQSEIEKISQNKKVVHIFKELPKISNLLQATVKNNNTNQLETVSVSPQLIDSSEFFQKRILNRNKLKGEIIKSDDEVIVSQSLIERLKLGNPIGSSLLLQPYILDNLINEQSKIPSKIIEKLSAINKELRIVAVFDTDSVFNEIIIRRDVLDDIQKQQLTILEEHNSLFNQIAIIDDSVVKDNDLQTNINQKVSNGLNFYNIKNNANIQDIELKLGRKPQNTREIIISEALYKKAPQLFDTKNKDNIFLFSEYWQTFTNNLLNRSVNVVGVYNSDQEEFKYHPKIKDIYLDNSQELTIYFDPKITNPNDLAEFSSDDGSYGKLQILKFPLLNYDLQLDISIATSNATLIVYAVFNAILIIFLVTYSKTVNNAKRKEFGILKSLGSSTIQTLFYNILGIIAISIISFLLTTIILLPTIKLIFGFVPNFFDQITYLDIFSAIATVWLISTVITLFLHILITYYMYKKSTSNLLN